ncbi:hypothetical protein PM082_006482 [Marasmius tenuissimus]|nr:hypothetical protein PM082_006482 [Marasmius tenuissimus]
MFKSLKVTFVHTENRRMSFIVHRNRTHRANLTAGRLLSRRLLKGAEPGLLGHGGLTTQSSRHNGIGAVVSLTRTSCRFHFVSRKLPDPTESGFSELRELGSQLS